MHNAYHYGCHARPTQPAARGKDVGAGTAQRCETSTPGVALCDRVCRDQTKASPGHKMGVRPPEEVSNKVNISVGAQVTNQHPVLVGGAQRPADLLATHERGIAYNTVEALPLTTK